MSGLIRAMKDATFRAERVMGVSILMSVAFCFYFEFLGEGNFSLQNLVSKLPFTLMLFAMMMFGLYGMIDIATYTQMAMSYGCTRKNAVLGMIWMQFLEIAETMILMVVLAYAIPQEWQLVDIMYQSVITLVMIVVSSGFALPVGIALRKFGKAAYIVIVVIICLVCGITGGVLGFLGAAEVDWLTMLAAGTVPFILPAIIIGIIYYIVCAVLFGLLMRKMEVRV